MTDLETDTGAELVTAWRDLLARQAATACALERELGEKHDLGMSEFEVLERLWEAALPDGKGQRSQDLACTVHLSQSALSRLVTRLEKAGLVTRALCEADRRGIYIVLTEAGRTRYLEARPTHRAVLDATLVRGGADGRDQK